jgi:hypothetical protein
MASEDLTMTFMERWFEEVWTKDVKMQSTR